MPIKPAKPVVPAKDRKHKLNLKSNQSLSDEQLTQLNTIVLEQIAKDGELRKDKYIVDFDPETKEFSLIDQSLKNSDIKENHLRFSVIQSDDGKLYAMHETLGAGAQGRVKAMKALKANSDGIHEVLAVKIKEAKRREIKGKESNKINEKLGYIKSSLTRKHGESTFKDYDIMELVPGREMFDVIFSHEKVTLYDKCLMAIGACQELLDLHDKGIVHRDVKAKNYMYDVKSKKTKLIDFDLSALVGVKSIKLVGTQGFFSPEILEVDNENTRRLKAREKKFLLIPYSKESDVFALGKTIRNIFITSLRDERSTITPQYIEEFLSAMTALQAKMTAEKSRRCSIQEALNCLHKEYVKLYTLSDLTGDPKQLNATAIQLIIKNINYELTDGLTKSSEDTIAFARLSRIQELFAEITSELSTKVFKEKLTQIKSLIPKHSRSENATLNEKYKLIAGSLDLFMAVVAKKEKLELEPTITIVKTAAPILAYKALKIAAIAPIGTAVANETASEVNPAAPKTP